MFTDPDLVIAVRAALIGERPDRALALHEHSWEDRVIKLTGADSVLVEYTPVSVVARPPIHYERPARLVAGPDNGGS